MSETRSKSAVLCPVPSQLRSRLSSRIRLELLSSKTAREAENSLSNSCVNSKIKSSIDPRGNDNCYGKTSAAQRLTDGITVRQCSAIAARGRLTLNVPTAAGPGAIRAGRALTKLHVIEGIQSI